MAYTPPVFCPGRLSTAWLISLVLFVFLWPSSGDTRGPSVVFQAVDMPCLGPFNWSHIGDYIYDLYLAIDSGGNVSDLVVARNCCMARMLP